MDEVIKLLNAAEKVLWNSRSKSHFLEQRKEADEQAALGRKVTDVLGRIRELESSLPPDQKERIAAMENLAARKGVKENLSLLDQKLRNVNGDNPAARLAHLSTTAELQKGTAAALAEMARILRAPMTPEAVWSKALEKIDAAIAQQKVLKEELEAQLHKQPDPKAPEQEIANHPKTLEKIRDLANKQARLEFDLDKIRNLVDPVAKEPAKELFKAEQFMEKATSKLQKTDPAKALPEQEKAAQILQEVRKELAGLIAQHKKEQVDPLARLENTSKTLGDILEAQKELRKETKEAGTDKENPKLPDFANRQEDLSNRLAPLKQEPLPGQPKVQEAIDKAVTEMKKATEDLRAKTPTEAVPKQDNAITALENFKKDVDKKIGDMKELREKIADLGKQSNKLDKLLEEQIHVAQKAKETAQDPQELQSSQGGAKSECQGSPACARGQGDGQGT